MGVLNPGTRPGGSKFRSLAAGATDDERLIDAIVVVPLGKFLSMLSGDNQPEDTEATQWRNDIGELLVGEGFTEDQVNALISDPPADPDTVEILPADKPLGWKGLTIAIGVKQGKQEAAAQE